MEFINVAYAVLEDYQITEKVTSSESPSEPSGWTTINSDNGTDVEDVGNLSALTYNNISYFIPQELMRAALSVVGGTTSNKFKKEICRFRHGVGTVA